MMKKKDLLRELPQMVKETRGGRLKWDVICQTTEFNPDEQKPVVEEDGKDWVVDECYVSYHCEYHGEEFVMITYEMIHSCGQDVRTMNLVFMPPLGIRVFDIHVLSDYAIENDQVLSYDVHMLWLALLEVHKNNPEQVKFDADERILTIE